MLTIVAALALPAPVQDAQAAIEAALADSAAGWSAGDMPRFLAIYADDAVFVTKNGLVRGKAAIAARYDKAMAPMRASAARCRFGSSARGRWMRPTACSGRNGNWPIPMVAATRA